MSEAAWKAMASMRGGSAEPPDLGGHPGGCRDQRASMRGGSAEPPDITAITPQLPKGWRFNEGRLS